MFYYAVTLKKTVPVKNVKQAETVINRYYKIIKFVKEMNQGIKIKPTLETVLKKNGSHNVHMHAMIKSDKELKLSIFPREKGLHVYFEECKSQLAWRAYINKDEHTMQDILDLIQSYSDTGSECDDLEEIPDVVRLYKRLV